ncbi:MAG: isocitrate/isopropylmalate dehydrogenase family protein [Ruminococcaceae bacterium]|nr:isocitrate/isopropylmalate dehydrogenase family protein [Oscillospiraceae bacterium]
MNENTNRDKQIEEAAEKFKKLLNEQLMRQDKIKNALPPKDYNNAENIKIGIADGDGIGPIIMAEARRVLNFLMCDEIKSGKISLLDIDGLTIENRQKLNCALPDESLDQILSCDVLLKGPTTTPSGGSLGSANVALRKELDLYANVRQIDIPEKGINWVFFRENTEGEYALGSDGILFPDEMAVDFKVTTDGGTKRIARAAFSYAAKNGNLRVSVVTKSNIMKRTDGMFSSICSEVAKDYPEIICDEWYVDIMSANLINEKTQADFKVFLLPNLYGDILTDEAAQIQGGVGTAGSANIGDRYAMFEAIHGSAPRKIEKGEGDYSNPESILRALIMLLNHIGRQDKAQLLENALDICTKKERKIVISGKKDGATGKEFGDYLLETLQIIKNK